MMLARKAQAHFKNQQLDNFANSEVKRATVISNDALQLQLWVQIKQAFAVAR